MKTRLLIIEDDAAIAQLHHRYLSQLEGFEVVGIATSQADARLQMEVLNPDLVLLDVYLPDGTGLELLQWIRGRNCSLRCDFNYGGARGGDTATSDAWWCGGLSAQACDVSKAGNRTKKIPNAAS
ncbi:response regulator [Vibrio cholerae]|nr:response regulator [Vibrio cholerae]